MKKITILTILSIIAMATFITASAAPYSSPKTAIAPPVVEYDVPTADSQPYGIVLGPDGNLWFTEYEANKIGRITPQGVITEYPLPSGFSHPASIVAGPDGALWFGSRDTNNLGRISTSGTITSYAFSSDGTGVSDIANGLGNSLWFTVDHGGQVGTMTTAGVSTVWNVSPSDGRLTSITAGPDNHMWFVGFQETYWGYGYIGEITASGDYYLYGYSTIFFNNSINSLVAAADGALWFVDQPSAKIRRSATDGYIENEYKTGAELNHLYDLMIGQDGDLWYSAPSDHIIGRISLSGQIKEFTLDSGILPAYMAQTPDGRLWFTDISSNKIGVVTFTNEVYLPNIYLNTR